MVIKSSQSRGWGMAGCTGCSGGESCLEVSGMLSTLEGVQPRSAMTLCGCGRRDAGGPEEPGNAPGP